MSEVFIVTAGSYSDYRILAVFSSKEGAKAYTEKLSHTELPISRGNYEIEEWDIDIPAEHWLKTVICMDKEGNVIEAWLDDNNGWMNSGFDSYGDLVWGVETEDRNRAIKVVNEVRGQIIALGLWGKGAEVRQIFGQRMVK